LVKKIEMKEKFLENFIPSFGKACRAAFMRGISSAGEKSRASKEKGRGAPPVGIFLWAAF